MAGETSSVSAAPMLERLRTHIPIAREGRDPEGVHQVRVATRRLRVFLELSGWRVLEDDLRWLREAAREARDLDVVMELGGDAAPPSTLRAWLGGRRHSARTRLIRAFDHPRTEALLRALELLPPCDAAEARKRRRTIAAKVIERSTAAEQPGQLDALHGWRRAVRRLRYSLDWLGEDAKPVKKLQDALGELGDMRAAIDMLDAYPDRAALSDYRHRLFDCAERARTKARSVWEQTGPYVESLTR